MKINRNIYYYANLSACLLVLAAAAWTLYKWWFAPYALQSEVRAEITAFCLRDSVCARIDERLTFNRDMKRMERRLWVGTVRGTSPHDAVALRNRLEELIDARAQAYSPITGRNALEAMKPIEVRYE